MLVISKNAEAAFQEVFLQLEKASESCVGVNTTNAYDGLTSELGTPTYRNIFLHIRNFMHML